MQINSFPSRFDPRCTTTTVLMNRHTIPNPDGITCKPCLDPVQCGTTQYFPSASQPVRIYFPIEHPFGAMSCIGGQIFTLTYASNISTFSPTNTCNALGSTYTGSFDVWNGFVLCTPPGGSMPNNYGISFYVKRSGSTTFQSGIGITYSGDSSGNLWSEQPCYSPFVITFPPFYYRFSPTFTCTAVDDFCVVSWD